jgi:hypothetical protein
MTANTKYPEIFRALAEPFSGQEIKTRPQGGQKLQYVTARTVMNRLDSVLGPEGWWDHYEAHQESVTCRLTILLPDGRELTKEDAGGYAGMADSGDDDKSGYSDAFKRAAVKFGVGRHLYRDGIPQFTGDAEANPTQSPAPNGGRKNGRDLFAWATREGAAIKKNLLKWLKQYGEANSYPEQIVDWNPDQSDAAYTALAKKLNAEADKAPAQASPAPTTNGTATDGHALRSGRALFAWTKEQEQKHEVGLLKYLNGWANLQDFPGRMVDWDADQVQLAYAECVRKLKNVGIDAPHEEALTN